MRGIVRLPAGRLDCFRAGAIATIYTQEMVSTRRLVFFFHTPPNESLTLGFANACWVKRGLRSIEEGTRARAALLNMPGIIWGGERRGKEREIK